MTATRKTMMATRAMASMMAAMTTKEADLHLPQ
jgi:hypothetical protein